jgi:hypothetical protein
MPAGKKRLAMNERDFAVERGLRFISQLAEMPECLLDLGADLLWCFHTISDTSKNQRLRRMALQIGQENADKWKQQVFEPERDPNELATFIFGVDAAERLLGESDQALKNRLQTLVRFGFASGKKCPPAASGGPMRRHTYCSNFSCSPVTLAAGLRPGARRVRRLPSKRSRPETNSAVPSGRPLPSASRKS